MSKAVELAKSMWDGPLDELIGMNWFLENFYHRAQVQALEDAATQVSTMEAIGSGFYSQKLKNIAKNLKP